MEIPFSIARFSAKSVRGMLSFCHFIEKSPVYAQFAPTRTDLLRFDPIYTDFASHVVVFLFVFCS